MHPHMCGCTRCDSFSQWWSRTTAGLGSVATLLAHADRADEDGRY
ncbi:hypothetical protein [Leptothrix discophora]|uniref:Uncharacterized protein n=1 Tax=Leptothrix discophora TaxID=89 RepID=A0ABT9G2G0_LEPDI|nr:hypothetical protein [Leptothrix discophora]MDP4300673.1 hypothetical protein [Leptothrix discophora]